MKKRRVFLPLLLSLALLCSFVLPAFAASYQNGSTGKVTVSGVWAFHGGRQPGEDSSTSNGGNRANHYNNRLYWYEGYSIDILQMDGSQYTPQYNGKTYFYCIHKWVNYGTGNRKFYVDPTGRGNLMNSPYWKNGLNQTQRELLMLVSMYGFPARTPQQLGVSTVDDAYAATQAIIWEIVTGRRNKSGLVSGYKSSAEELNSGIPAAKNNVNYFHDCYMLYAYDGNGHKKGEATPALRPVRQNQREYHYHYGLQAIRHYHNPPEKEPVRAAQNQPACGAGSHLRHRAGNALRGNERPETVFVQRPHGPGNGQNHQGKRGRRGGRSAIPGDG